MNDQSLPWALVKTASIRTMSTAETIATKNYWQHEQW